jgi:hypothetical protein
VKPKVKPKLPFPLQDHGSSQHHLSTGWHEEQRKQNYQIFRGSETVKEYGEFATEV